MNQKQKIEKSTRSNNWASPAAGKNVIATLNSAESRFPVSLIATERKDLVTCGPGDDAREAAAKQQVADFDHLPVLLDGAIIGLFSRKEKYERGTVKDVMQPICERIIMSADASMLNFLETADERRFVFLVSGDQISGAVSLSDMQKIAARPPIFLRLTLFEILVTNWLRSNANETWLEQLSSQDRSKIEKNHQKRMLANQDVDLISVADLRPKLNAALKLDAFNGLSDASEQIQILNDFRNSIAHASDFADNPISAAAVPKHLRTLRRYIWHFETLETTT